MKVREDTYENQVVEQRSHSFAFGFPPEGDFAPEAHHTLAPPDHTRRALKKIKRNPKTNKQTNKLTKKTTAETEGSSGFKKTKQLKLQERELP